MTFQAHLYGTRKDLASLLAAMPATPENRRVLIQLLFEISAGEIISHHITSIQLSENGRLCITIDDQRWVSKIEQVSDVILARINHMANDMNRPDAIVKYLSTRVSLSYEKQDPKKQQTKKKETPNKITENAESLPETVKEAFLTWYRTVSDKQK